MPTAHRRASHDIALAAPARGDARAEGDGPRVTRETDADHRMGMDSIRFGAVRESATGGVDRRGRVDRSIERAMMETGAMETVGGGEEARDGCVQDGDARDGDVKDDGGEDGEEGPRVGVAVETMVNPVSVVTPDEATRPPVGAAVHMTERQLYAFRQQIAVYAHICQQLLQITTVNATQQTDRQRAVRRDVPGTEEMRTTRTPTGAGTGWSGNAGMNAIRIEGGGHRGGRGEDKSQRGPRWSGTPKHYEILENLFLAGEQPPVRERLREVTEMLSQHGYIQESNVYNWFQNRRSREKKKIAEEQALAAANANAAMQM